MSHLLERLKQLAIKQPDSIAIQDASQHLSYDALYMNVHRLSLKLSSLGVKHIGIWMDNSPQ